MTVMATEQSTDQVYDWADAVELAMESKPLGTGWTPSTVARKAKLTTDQARAALRLMEDMRLIEGDGNGAWRRWYLKSGRYGWTTEAGLPTNVPPSKRGH